MIIRVFNLQMDSAKGWEKRILPNTGTSYYFHSDNNEYQIDPPYYQILGLDPAECQKYGKSDIQGAWFQRAKAAANDEDAYLIREAYEVLRYTESRVAYNQCNVLGMVRIKNNTAIDALAAMLDN